MLVRRLLAGADPLDPVKCQARCFHAAGSRARLQTGQRAGHHAARGNVPPLSPIQGGRRAGQHRRCPCLAGHDGAHEGPCTLSRRHPLPGSLSMEQARCCSPCWASPRSQPWRLRDCDSLRGRAVHHLCSPFPFQHLPQALSRTGAAEHAAGGPWALARTAAPWRGRPRPAPAQLCCSLGECSAWPGPVLRLTASKEQGCLGTRGGHPSITRLAPAHGCSCKCDAPVREGSRDAVRQRGHLLCPTGWRSRLQALPGQRATSRP